MAIKTAVERAEIPADMTDCTTPLPQGLRTMGHFKKYVAKLFGVTLGCQNDAAAVREMTAHE